jgi:formylglycine-generating enzyme required for sulfatase activity
MGSPASEPMRHEIEETPRRMLIPRRFAIAAKEVTVEQWQRFERTNAQYQMVSSFVNQVSPDPDGPMISFTWYIAAHYCNWLSEQEALPKDQWCYLPNEAGAYAEGMSIPADVLQRTGYRLPTEAEWEYACRSGAVTSRYFGQSVELLGKYAWYHSNSKEHAWPCGSLLPNDLGLFDMLGNELEWVQDPFDRPMQEKQGPSSDTIVKLEHVSYKIPRVIRGGTFNSLSAHLRSAFRFWIAPATRYSYYGFRPARTRQ